MIQFITRSFLKIQLLAIWLFIIVHLANIFTSSFPDESKLSELIQDKLSVYVDYTGIAQNWSMFAPNPARLNAYVEAKVFFQDGSSDIWILPRPTQSSVLENFLGGDRPCTIAERYLKPGRHLQIWRDVAAYTEREINKNEAQGRNREIKALQFYRYSNYVSDPKENFVPHGVKASYEKSAAYYYEPTGKVRHEASYNHQFNK